MSGGDGGGARGDGGGARGDDTSGQDGSALRSLSRGVEILALLGSERPSLSLREILSATSFPKTSVLRYLQTLEAAGLLWVDRTGRYLLGPQLARWAELAATTWQPSRALGRVLEDLVAKGEETVHVYIRRDLRRVCIAREEVRRPLRHVVGLGESLPLWGGAASMILLGEAPDAVLEKVASASPEGAGGAERLRHLALAASQRGWAASDGELEPGLSSVAVPLRDADGVLFAALSFGGPSIRFDPSARRRLRDLLLKAASTIQEGWLPGLASPAPRNLAASSRRPVRP